MLSTSADERCEARMCPTCTKKLKNLGVAALGPCRRSAGMRMLCAPAGESERGRSDGCRWMSVHVGACRCIPPPPPPRPQFKNKKGKNYFPVSLSAPKLCVRCSAYFSSSIFASHARTHSLILQPLHFPLPTLFLHSHPHLPTPPILLLCLPTFFSNLLFRCLLRLAPRSRPGQI